jgi:hypothetical protein
VSAGVDGTLYLTEEGRVLGAGNNSNNQLGLNKAGGLCGPIRAKAMKARMVDAVEEGAELVRECCEPGGRISLDTSGNPRQRASDLPRFLSCSLASFLACTSMSASFYLVTVFTQSNCWYSCRVLSTQRHCRHRCTP